MDNSRLQNEEGQRCCLGFLAVACGYEPKQIIGISSPAGVNTAEEKTLFPEEVCVGSYLLHNTNWTYNAMAVNDASEERLFGIAQALALDVEEESPDLREKMLIKLFEQIDIELSFVD